MRMNNRTFWLLLIGISMGLALVLGDVQKSVIASDARDLDTITIDNKGYSKDRKSPVVFEHRAHAYDYEISCWSCHHDFKDGEDVWSPWGETKQCRECHDPVEKKGDAFKLQKAYHFNCKNCHKEMEIFGPGDREYRVCSVCHIDE